MSTPFSWICHQSLPKTQYKRNQCYSISNANSVSVSGFSVSLRQIALDFRADLWYKWICSLDESLDGLVLSDLLPLISLRARGFWFRTIGGAGFFVGKHDTVILTWGK